MNIPTECFFCKNSLTNESCYSFCNTCNGLEQYVVKHNWGAVFKYKFVIENSAYQIDKYHNIYIWLKEIDGFVIIENGYGAYFMHYYLNDDGPSKSNLDINIANILDLSEESLTRKIKTIMAFK